MSELLLRISRVSKSFPGVKALREVSLEVEAGEIHAIVGENGAGKSTLMNILAGVYAADSGEVHWNGRPLSLESTAEAQHQGISIIFQELNLIPHLSVAENILINREPVSRAGFLDWRRMNGEARNLLRLLNADIAPTAIVGDLSVAEQQITEVVKALSYESKLLIMDEPTAALNREEVGNLFEIIRELKRAGKAVIFISHRLKEVFEISDKITVIKDGEVVKTAPRDELTREDVVRHMVGRTLRDTFPSQLGQVEDEAVLEVKNLETERLQGVSFKLRRGQITGVAGLAGHGQRDLGRALFGLTRHTAGEILIDGAEPRLSTPRDAIRSGISFVSDDRRDEGLALSLSVRENISLPNLEAFSRFGLVNSNDERSRVSEISETIGIETPSIEQTVRYLSGGNQQKAVLAKWLMRQPKVFVFDEPTRGIDVGAKIEIYGLMRELAEQGVAILMISSDLIELLGMSDQILVLHDGRISAVLTKEEADEEKIMLAATGTVINAASD